LRLGDLALGAVDPHAGFDGHREARLRHRTTLGASILAVNHWIVLGVSISTLNCGSVDSSWTPSRTYRVN
jgi:hypothetical protein